MRIGVVLAGVAAAVLALPAVAQTPVSGERVDLGRYAGPLRIEAVDGGVLEIDDGRRFTGVLETRLSASGELVLVNDVDLESYVEGIAEMPAGWPMEALKAQAIAARTYAWYQATRNAFDGYDICSTTACQVFRGREIVETPEVGERWAQAVAATAGQVLLFEGAPILARYFSTSGGHTFNNEDVFPRSGPFSYLVGVPDPDDAVSPLHTWTTTFTRDQFDAIARRGTQLPAVVPIASVERRPRPDPTPDRIVVTGQNGQVVDVTAGQLQGFLNAAAPNAFPDLFPGPRDNGIQRLPSTVPSGRYEVEVTDSHVILHGSGWGHGVGMGQYGARGKADRGLTATEILAAYYNGLAPSTTPALPERIRVGMSAIGDGLSLSSSSVFTVSAGSDVIVERGLGTFTISEAADRTLRLEAPAGHGVPLVLSELAASRTRPFTVEQVGLDVVTNKPVELVLRATPADGGPGIQRTLGVAEPGRQAVAWDLDDEDGRPVAPGAWDVVIMAVDEEADTREAATSITIAHPAGDAATVRSVLLASIARVDAAPAVLLLAGAVGTLVGLVSGRLFRRREQPRE